MPNVVTLSVLPLLLSRSSAVCAYANAQHEHSNAASVFFIPAPPKNRFIGWWADAAHTARRPRPILLHPPTRHNELHCRADDPRGELVFAVSPLLAFGFLARRGLEYELEEFAAGLRDRFRAVDDGAAIEIHVLFLARIQRRVGGEFQRGRGLAAVGRTASGSEANQVGAARNLAGRRHRIETRRVHIDKTARGHRLRILIDLDKIGGAALGHRAERFFQDSSESAGLVAGRRIVVHLVAVA